MRRGPCRSKPARALRAASWVLGPGAIRQKLRQRENIWRMPSHCAARCGRRLASLPAGASGPQRVSRPEHPDTLIIVNQWRDA